MKCMRCDAELLDLDARCPICDFSLPAWISANNDILQKKNKKIAEDQQEIRRLREIKVVPDEKYVRAVQAIQELLAWHDRPEEGSTGYSIHTLANEVLEEAHDKSSFVAIHPMADSNITVTSEELNKVWGNANFGSESRLDTVRFAVLKYACGFTSGSTAERICIQLGLLTKTLHPQLTRRARYCLWEWFGQKGY